MAHDPSPSQPSALGEAPRPDRVWRLAVNRVIPANTRAPARPADVDDPRGATWAEIVAGMDGADLAKFWVDAR